MTFGGESLQCRSIRTPHGHVSREDFQKGIKVRAILRIALGKSGQEPIVRSTLGAIWLLVPDPFSQASVFQKQPFAWGLALNRENRNDHFLSLVSRSDCPTDADSTSNGILRAKESSKSAGFVGDATNPCQTSFPAKVRSGTVCRHTRNAPRTASSS